MNVSLYETALWTYWVNVVAHRYGWRCEGIRHRSGQLSSRNKFRTGIWGWTTGRRWSAEMLFARCGCSEHLRTAMGHSGILHQDRLGCFMALCLFAVNLQCKAGALMRALPGQTQHPCFGRQFVNHNIPNLLNRDRSPFSNQCYELVIWHCHFENPVFIRSSLCDSMAVLWMFLTM